MLISFTDEFVHRYEIYKDKLITLSHNNIIKIWNLLTGICETTIESTDDINSIQINGNIIVRVYKKIYIWNMKGELKETLPFDHSIRGIFLIDDDHMIIVLDVTKAYVYNLKTKSLNYLNEFNIITLIMSLGDDLVLIQETEHVSVWNYKLIRRLYDNEFKFTPLINKLDNDNIVFANRGGLLVWNYETNRKRIIIPDIDVSTIHSFKNRIVISSKSGKIEVYE
jgi:hypothetical protein